MATTDVQHEYLTDDFEPIAETPDEGNGAHMTLIEHLAELRRRLFVCIIAVIVLAIVAFIFYDPILHFLLLPLPRAANVLAKNSSHPMLTVHGIGEGFGIVLKLSIAVGIAAATPIWLYQLWGFLAPALTHKEKKYAIPFTLIGVGLFAVGLAVGFVTLRFPIDWLVHFGDQFFIEQISADSYFSFVTFFLLAFGIAFELPLVLTFLSLIGVVSSRTLGKNRPYILLALWVISCFITPGSDPYSPVILGIAFTVLYFLSEVLIRAIGK